MNAVQRPRLVCLFLLSLLVVPALGAPQQRGGPERKKAAQREDAAQRAESLRAICQRLEIGAEKSIADIGAGNGRDSWVFAEIVGPQGKVHSEEIDEKKCDSLGAAAEQRKLAQVQAVLGTATSAELPDAAVDMAFMHFVYHHIAQPREMLQSIWKSLRPGGYLVIVDQRLGTLADWVPREQRAGKHFWIAETTVVREARENGFKFVDCLDTLWHAKGSFVLVFQRPADLAQPDRDPDASPAIPASLLTQLVPTRDMNCQRIAFVALGEGRQLMAPILKATSCSAVDIVLEEWATQKEERPAGAENLQLPTLLTEKGDPHLNADPLDAVYFLDTYHLLFHAPQLLEQLQQHLSSTGRVYVVDRAAPEPLSHRLASHRRMIGPQLVIDEMQQAGFVLEHQEGLADTGRFFMVFSRKP